MGECMPIFEGIDSVKDRINRIELERIGHDIDDQEMSEREEAASKQAEENDKHLVDYAYDCINTSKRSNENIRQIQFECLDLYHEEEPDNYADKEDWQSRVVIPGPFSSVQHGMAAVRKAFKPNFLSIENKQNPSQAEFWKRMMDFQLSRDHADFKTVFTDASGFGFAVGQSLEMIPIWDEYEGLKYLLIEPWKIHRDPDASPRHPQDGMYWIHQEYIDYFQLKRAEKDGIYSNIDKARDNASIPEESDLSEEELARRKNKIYTKSEFRKALLVSEFWGVVLDKKGNLLLPNARYTIAGNNVVSHPKRSPYRSLKWPGISFSPIPNFLSYEGRGLLQGVRSLWNFMNSLMCLHNDNLNWVVNPMGEIEITALVDQDDIASYPGKDFLTRGTISGHQVYRTIERRSQTPDVMSIQKFATEKYDLGTFVSHSVRGEVGPREITGREAAQNLDQSMGVFGSIGENNEDGALDAIRAGMECVAINADYKMVAAVFGEEYANTIADPQSATGVKIPEITGNLHVSGLSAILKDNETMKNIRDTILPLAGEGSVFQPYLKPYNILKSIEIRTNLADENMVVDETKAQEINNQIQQRAQEIHDAQMEAIAKEDERKAMEHDANMANIELEKVNIELKGKGNLLRIKEQANKKKTETTKKAEKKQ